MIDEVLTGRRITLRPISIADRDWLHKIFSDPSVAQWWGDPAKAVRDTIEGPDEESHFLIEVGGEPVGMIQCFEEISEMYRYAAIDIALREKWQGNGIGPEAIRTLARFLIERRGHHRLTIDPAAHNTRAIRAYEKVGFRRVGVLRQYERGEDGSWHDGLLMDLLAGELHD